ncbi:MAG TPA: phenylacetic acid degradation protein PaaD, partial [Candidatus Competibacteraceae bacterium]|nr:phenylacetic acid degradation protein PaaD [Candidatus Competibacteraceae bacterium]
MLDPFMNLLGLQGEITAPGQARVWGTIRPEFLNSWGSAHGGFLYSVADAAFALASNSHGTLAVALSAHIEYVQASEVGATVEARAIEAHLGRRTAVYRIEIHSGEKLLALF